MLLNERVKLGLFDGFLMGRFDGPPERATDGNAVGTELENNVGSINNENCYASCMSAYIFRYYCNYLCYHLRFQTTSTTEPPTTLGNSKRWYPIRRG